MSAIFGTNRAGRPCVVYPDGTHDAQESVEAAMQAVRRANAQVRLINRRAATEIARVSLGELSLRKGVALHILPDFITHKALTCERKELVRA